MKFDKATLTYDISPISIDTPGKYTIQVTVTDTVGASKSYTFDVVVFAESKSTSTFAEAT